MSLSATSTRVSNTSSHGDSTASFGQPVTLVNHSLREGVFPSIQSVSSLIQLEAISPCIACYLGEEANPCLVK